MFLLTRSRCRRVGRAWPAALIVASVLTGPVEALALFQYTDDAGTLHFTDDPGQIPEPIRKRMGIWVEEPQTPPQPDPRLGLRAPEPPPIAPEEAPVQSATAPHPHQGQPAPAGMVSPWVPGLIGLIATGGLLVGLRFSKQRVRRIALKVAVVLVVTISSTATVMVALAERGSSLEATVRGAGAKVEYWKSRVESPFKDAERRAKEVGKAKREYQETINQLERQIEALP